MNRAMSSSRKVSVSFDCVPTDSDQVPVEAAGRHEPLDDEPVGCLEEQDVPHAALVEERPDGAEDLLEVLAGAALVDPHAVGPSPVRTRQPGRIECSERPHERQGGRRVLAPPGRTGVGARLSFGRRSVSC